jgi:hypothetical protein
MSAKPYKISVPQSKLESLKTKLSLAEFPDELSEAGWDLGAPLADVKRLAKAWQSFDWRAAEAQLNELPQYHIGIKVDGFDELDIHFVHQKSHVKNAIPLLFVHGCKLVSPFALQTQLKDIYRARIIHRSLTHPSASIQTRRSSFSHCSPFTS